MNTLTKLISIYNNKAETSSHKLSEQILMHAHEIPRMSIYKLADICYSSTAAISRFVRRLEYENFHLFKSSLGNALNYYPQSNRKIPVTAIDRSKDFIEEYTAAVSQALTSFSASVDPEMLDRFIDGIADAHQIIFVAPDAYGFFSFQLDLFLQQKISYFSDNLTDSAQDIRRADSESFVLFFVPPERESSRAEALMNLARTKGAKIGIVSRDIFSVPRHYTQLIIPFKSTGSDLDEQLLTHLMNLFIFRFRMKYIDFL